jgi:hypothetical protein
LIVLAFAFVAGVAEQESSTPAHAASLHSPEQHGIAQNESAPAGARFSAARPGDHYLMLVNTAIASQMDTPKMAEFDRSPYDGLAVSFADAYDTTPALPISPMKAQLANWKKSTAKEIWPWVYLNRMVGANDAEGNPAKIQWHPGTRRNDDVVERPIGQEKLGIAGSLRHFIGKHC